MGRGGGQRQCHSPPSPPSPASAPLSKRTMLTLVAAQSIQPLPLGSMFISTSPSTRSGKMSCRERETGECVGSPRLPPENTGCEVSALPISQVAGGSEEKDVLWKGFKTPQMTQLGHSWTPAWAPLPAAPARAPPRLEPFTIL